jgi:hypothetical protein
MKSGSLEWQDKSLNRQVLEFLNVCYNENYQIQADTGILAQDLRDEVGSQTR